MELTIAIEDPSRRSALYGASDRNLRLIRSAFDVQISARDGQVRIVGEPDSVGRAAQVLEQIQRSLRTQPDVPEDFIHATIRRISSIEASQLGRTDGIDVFLSNATIVPRGEGQKRYIDAIHNHDITFCIGPAGTGKTYLAVAVAISMLKQHRLKRVALVRPAVEAGEKLGYLPGDMQAKVNPYLRPLFDAMHDMMGFDQIKRFMQNDVIEIIPLAFMRGRTLNSTAIILDEAQNATQQQMLMFLTRLGRESKMIVTGDASQSDLGKGHVSGLIDAVARLEGVPGIAVVHLDKADIVRHRLVQHVVSAYARPAGAVAGCPLPPETDASMNHVAPMQPDIGGPG